MDRLSEILRCQWRAYWRRVTQASSLAVGHQGITLIIAFLVFFKYLALVVSAGDRLAQGDTTVLKSLFAIIFLAWLFLPLSSRSEISLNSFLHLPLSLTDLFMIRVASILITPHSWLVIAGSLAIFYPLAYAQSPSAAIAMGLLFIMLSALLGLIVVHLFSVVLFRRLLFALLLVLITASFFTNAHLLLTQPRPFESATLLRIGNKPVQAVAVLLLMNAVAFIAALWSLQLTLWRKNKRSVRRRRSSVLFNLRGAVGTLAAKDVRYFRTLLDPYLGVLASALGCVYLIGAATPTLPVILIFIVIVFLPNCPLAFNSFGLDTRDAWDRYAVLPVTGQTIIRAKNVAFLIIASLQLAPILLLTLWRLGPSATLISLLTSWSIACAYLALGNWMSISLPARMYPFRFAPATGSLPEIIAGIFIGSLPGIVVISSLRASALPGIWSPLAILILFTVIYWRVTAWSSRRFERRRDKMALALALR